MTVRSGELLLSSFKGHVHDMRYMWYIWLLYCNIETNKAADSANIFLKRVIKEIIFININVEGRLQAFSPFLIRILISTTNSKSRSPLKQPFSSPTFLELLRLKEHFTPMSICGYTLQCFLLGGPLPATQTQKPAKLQHCALLFIWSLASNWNTF